MLGQLALCAAAPFSSCWQPKTLRWLSAAGTAAVRRQSMLGFNFSHPKCTQSVAHIRQTGTAKLNALLGDAVLNGTETLLYVYTRSLQSVQMVNSLPPDRC